jgi:hypothetical protein
MQLDEFYSNGPDTIQNDMDAIVQACQSVLITAAFYNHQDKQELIKCLYNLIGADPP